MDFSTGKMGLFLAIILALGWTLQHFGVLLEIKEKLSKKKPTARGKLSAQLIDTNKPITVLAGNNLHQMPWSKLAKGVSLHGLSSIQIGAESPPFKARVENGKILIDAEIQTIEGKRLLLINNEWNTRLDGFDINSNLNAIEIVDQQLNPILQLAFFPGNYLIVNGYTVQPSGEKLWYSENGIFNYPVGLLKWFLYPSAEHPSELAVPEKRLKLPLDSALEASRSRGNEWPGR